MLIFFRNFILSAFLYWLFGRLGLFLAIPPGFASTVWPAAGIALALGLVLKRGVFLGVVFGSLINNLIPLFNVGLSFFNITPLLSGLLIGIGAATQMQLGCFLINYYTDKNLELQSVRDIIKVFTIAIPVSCFVNGIWGSLVLYWFHIIPSERYITSAFTWYLGDTLGALVFTPLILSFLLKTEIWRQRRLVYSLPMFLLIILVFYLFNVERSDDQRKMELAFDDRVDEIKMGLKNVINNSSEVLNYIDSYYMSSEFVTRKEFQKYVEGILARYPEILALSWNPYVSHKNRKSFEQQMRSEGFKDFLIKEKHEDRFIPAYPRDFYVPIGYIEPYSQNAKAQGYDIYSQYTRRQALEKAQKQKIRVATEAIDLVQENESRRGYLITKAIEKNDKLIGFAVSVVSIHQIFQKALNRLDLAGLEIYAFDTTNKKLKNLLYSTEGENILISPEDILAKEQKVGSFYKHLHLEHNTRNWEVIIYQNPEYYKQRQSLMSWFVIGAGLIISLITGTFILLVSGREYRLKRISQELQISQDNLLDFTIKLEQKVKERTKELELANKAKSVFLANMSHEIRTPLNGILGALQLLDEEHEPEIRKSLINIIKSSGKLLLSIVNDILDLSKLESSKLNLEELDLNLDEVILQCIHLAENTGDRGNEFTYEGDDLSDLAIKGDAVRLSQVLTNLLSNANKFTKDGKITTHLKVLEKSDDELKLKFSVSDTGIGISEDKIQKIFEPFTQEDDSTTRNFGGTGLGLSICKELVELMHGELKVQSQIGKGTTFTFTILLKYSKSYSNNPQVSEQHSINVEHLRILIVEDNKINQVILEKFLAKYNIIADLATNGEEAIEYLRHNTVDLVFMDYHMPVMDGIQATKILRDEIDPEYKIVIVALSASVTQEVRENYIKAGMNDIIGKPITKEALEKILISFSK